MTIRAPAVTDIPEGDLLRLLFGTFSTLGNNLYRELNPVPRTRPYFAVREPILPRGVRPGDIDLFMAHIAAPERSTAVEAKRLKITPELLHTRRMGKLSGLAKGVAQANALHRLGFHRVALLLIVVVDTRGVFAESDLDYKTLDPFIHALLRKDPLNSLHRAVALAVFELTQPENKPIQQLAVFGHRVFRRGRRQTQPPPLTARIQTFLKADPYWQGRLTSA